MQSVQVLLSTYNGAKYLREQIDSILNQQNVKVSLLIRDDGSSDETLGILKEYSSKHNNIEVVLGKNIGWKKSFMWLVYNSSRHDYYAFADQDDIWLPNKLHEAVKKLSSVSGIAMYYSWSTLVDENLNPLKDYKVHEEPENMYTVLINPWAQGSTIVFNLSARNLVREYKINSDCAHDMWIYILCYFLGEIIFDENSYILYRQHQNNFTEGFANGKVKFPNLNHLKKRLIDILDSNFYINYASFLYHGYRDCLSDEDVKALKDFTTYKNSIYSKIRLITNRKIKKRTIPGTIALKISILFSRFSKD